MGSLSGALGTIKAIQHKPNCIAGRTHPIELILTKRTKVSKPILLTLTTATEKRSNKMQTNIKVKMFCVLIQICLGCSQNNKRLQTDNH